jgi:hypothetical protein
MSRVSTPGTPAMQDLGRFLLVMGLGLAVVGLLLVLGPRLPGASWIGRLPGDLYIERPNLRIYLPLGTCVLVSVVASLLVYVFRR